MTIETRRDLIEPWPTREACIAANRRALALLVEHHGAPPPAEATAYERRVITRLRRIYDRQKANAAARPRRSAGQRKRWQAARELALVTAPPDAAAALQPAPESIDDIITRTAGAYRVSPEDVLGRNSQRPPAAVLAFNEAVYLARRQLGIGSGEIARRLERSRANIYAALIAHEARLRS